MLKLKEQILELFKSAGHEKSPEAEAELILFTILRKKYPEIRDFYDLRKGTFIADPSIVEEVLKLAEARCQGVPLQHLLGHQYFFAHEYQVNSSTLVPRPETEILVQSVIECMNLKKTNGDFSFAELGLGSGILSAEVLAKFPSAKGVASEVNRDAVSLAKANLESILGPTYASRISIRLAKAFEGFEIFLDFAPFDFILSNPPYVSTKDEIEGEVLKHEPRAALFPPRAGDRENPNYFYENFLTYSSTLIKPGGYAFFEIPHERAPELRALFIRAGARSVDLITDLTGRDRVLQAGF